MGQVIGRVTADLGGERGPDGFHRVSVPQKWLDSGATIRFELPRNLACAVCEGGGCDACGRSGAVSTRARRDEPERVQVSLPKTQTGAVSLRIPARGGLAEPDLELPRGHLLLKVVGSSELEPEPGIERVAFSLHSLRPGAGANASQRVLLGAFLAAVVIAVLMWLWLR